MKIFYIYRAIAHYRGMERIFVDKINYLVQMYNYDVWLVTADQGNHPFSYPLNEKAHHVDLKIRFHSASKYGIFRRAYEKIRLQYLFVKRLKNLIATQSPDVLVCNTDVFTNLVMLVKGDIPLVVESHSICRQTMVREGDHFHRILYRWFTFWNYRHASSLVALTDSDAKEWQKYNSHTCAIANVVHLNPKGRVSNLSSNRVIFTSRFSPQKGIPYLLEIWKRVHLCHPDWQLDIYAQGELRDYYLPIIETLNININVYDAIRNIFDRYCDSSIFILTSVYEPFGLVLPEAMSCGLPVVSFDCDYGPREIITDNVDGFLVPLGDVNKFADRICELIDNYKLRVSMGNAGVASSKRFSPEIVMPLWKSLFEEII
ncbi:MAG: glycosyltransferase family 4 protein [Bacilli bacterium]|nr:glycosyltransferase family 4 protein [Methanobrevibacter sp.]MBR0059830.1 glycosyltransferase family 4 protein [Methanobrevibacter sp.]MBR0440151.1 glycosyltransferase family 4 protein [Bacilli bacterium]